ncbi:MAG: dockerin type I repeat-containing protein [Ruminococcus sp.]|nr:dockerin type I repeat-containing protein [Ruminococcus sp.]
MKKFKGLMISTAVLLCTATAGAVQANAGIGIWGDSYGTFCSGDINMDEECTVADAVLMQKYLLGSLSQGEKFIAENIDIMNTADLNLDGKIDVFDFIIMRDCLINPDNQNEISWRVDSFATAKKEACETVGKEYIFTSAEQTDEYFRNFAYEDCSCIGKYTDDFFQDNVLLMKPVFEDSVGNFYSINKIFYDGNTMNIDYTYNYFGEISEELDVPVLLLVTVPKSRYHAEEISWNSKKRSWDFIDDILKPEISEYNTFEFTSPDGKQTIFVNQSARKYKYEDSVTEIEFYRNFDHYETLEELEIIGTDTVYVPFSDEDNFTVEWKDSSVVFTFTADKEYVFEFDYVNTDVITQTITKEISNMEKPEIYSVDLTADCSGRLEYKSEIRDMYRIDVMTSGTVGLVGTPIKFTLDEDVSDASAVMHYNEDELRWVDENNLALLSYDKVYQSYYRCNDAVIDTENNTITFGVEDNRIYVLVDDIEWTNYWGKDRTEYRKEVNVLSYVSDWERGYNTGDIMNLCDKEWAMANAPDFRVSTPEQLASVVWYVNASGFKCSITLENDIDLNGYNWVPMGYEATGVGNKFNGTVDGNGYVIKNMNINSNYYNTGFIGIGGSDIRNITFENANITGGICTGIVCGSTYADFTNVNVSGNVTSNGRNTGAIAGYAPHSKFTDCTHAI